MTEVLFQVEDGIGRITLDRPRAINALNHAMIRAIDAQLAAWEHAPEVRIVLLTGAGERGFCAGGDIRALYEDARTGRMEGPATFFRDEYRLNARIARYTKPIVVFMTGITMGGGIGLAAHASHRVVALGATLAMPEVGIGFLPDVGATYLLARAPGELGTHVALTAARLGPADTLLCGLADVCIDPQALGAVATALPGCADAAAITTLLREHAAPAPAGVLDDARAWIDACYGGDRVEHIAEQLRARPEQQAQAAAAEIAHHSPTSLKITLHALRAARAEGLSLEACLQQEYRAAMAAMKSRDFVEGVRAAVVDKDRNPKWTPSQLNEVGPETIAAYFAADAHTELWQ